MLKTIVLLVLAALVVLAGIIALQPAEYRVTRSAKINAPAGLIFDQINDFHQWPAWSPWAKLDPGMKVTHSGPEAGPGAAYAWVGNKDVGAGNMKILETRPKEFVRIRLEFITPFVSVANTEFTVQPEGGATTVTWTMDGTNGFIEKAFCLFQNMDKLIGPDFEKGLAQLKTVAESRPN